LPTTRIVLREAQTSGKFPPRPAPSVRALHDLGWFLVEFDSIRVPKEDDRFSEVIVRYVRRAQAAP
jgi:hypothetical protein